MVNKKVKRKIKKIIPKKKKSKVCGRAPSKKSKTSKVKKLIKLAKLGKFKKKEKKKPFFSFLKK